MIMDKALELFKDEKPSFPDKQIQELIEYLQGTCGSLDEGCQIFGFDSEDLTTKQLLEINSYITQCPSCGWWVESYQMVNEEYCEDCFEDKEEE